MSELDEMIEGLRVMQASRTSCLLDVEWGVMINVLGALQLALRHPNMPRNAGGQVRLFVDRLIEEIDTTSPLLATAMRRGDDRKQDK